MADTPTATPNPCQGNWWQCFLNSLATPGGNLFVLFVLLVLFVPAMVMLMVWYGPGAPVVITMVTITSGFAAAVTTRMGQTQGMRSTDGNGAPSPAK